MRKYRIYVATVEDWVRAQKKYHVIPYGNQWLQHPNFKRTHKIIPGQFQSYIPLGALLPRALLCHTRYYLTRTPESVNLNFQFQKT